MQDKASITALMSAFARAYYAENSKAPVFADTVARRLMTDEEYAEIAKYIVDGAGFFAPGRSFASGREALDWVVFNELAPTPAVRARYCEDCLKTAVRTGTTQYVILGAGLDTFAWRETGLMKRLRVFEADRKPTQDDKKERLARAGLEIPQALRFVPVDFSVDDLKEKLTESGFDETQKTFFSWLGVSYYLTDGEIDSMLDSIASFAAEGSTIVFDYADGGLFTAKEKRVERMLAMAAAGGEPMKFSADELELTVMLERHNFLIYEHLSPAEADERYFYPAGAEMTSFEHICLATAVLKGAPFINTKEKILQQALLLFSRKGYDATSMQDIADTLSITKAALYRHYAGKRAIFERIVERMEEKDAERARRFGLPERSAELDPGAYKKARLMDMADFAAAQFAYWTEDPFASRFRRMLTLEQYGSPEMTALYQQYLAAGPLSYTGDVLAELLHDAGEAGRAALAFYAPMFLLYSVYDGAEDKTLAQSAMKEHVRRFREDMETGMEEKNNGI